MAQLLKGKVQALDEAPDGGKGGEKLATGIGGGEHVRGRRDEAAQAGGNAAKIAQELALGAFGEARVGQRLVLGAQRSDEGGGMRNHLVSHRSGGLRVVRPP
jgi:hypothetical protein